MCGIVGAVAQRYVAPILVEGLKRLEYRGYDSAGIAVVDDSKQIDRVRVLGKVRLLDAELAKKPLNASIGIAHTRWATHGEPSTRNAHPHVCRDQVALVHNGIIENHAELRTEQAALGYEFDSETDTEVVVNQVHYYLSAGKTLLEAVTATTKHLEGAFSLGVMSKDEPKRLIATRRGSPLVIGLGIGENFIASDVFALLPVTQRFIILEEGDIADITRKSITIYDETGHVVTRPETVSELSPDAAEKSGYRHFMLKEIFEQPAVIGDTLHSYLTPATGEIKMPKLPFDLAGLPKITIIACGTSFYAAMVAKYWFEEVARVSVEVDVASEFRYREAPMPEGGLAIFISQSGETADTLAALKYCKSQGQHIVTVVNVAESSMARESDAILQTLAGPEIGVASTKAFTCQLATLACLVIATARARDAIDEAEEDRLSAAIAHVPAIASQVLNHDQSIRKLAGSIFEARDVLYLGRGTGYPLAMEGALKLKEISYIHAEGYAAGEMKHGPIALIDEQVPVIVIAPTDHLFDKTVSNMREVMARGGKVIFLSDSEGLAQVGDEAFATIELPKVDPFVAPILYSIPVQLLAYHVAVLKGTDVDQPRNLAKSVTVE